INPITCSNVGGQTLSGGVATCQISTLTAGPHTISAVYDGDTNFTTRTGNLNTNPQVVNKTNTTTALGSSATPSPPTPQGTYTATVSTSSGTPTVTVAFKDNGSDISGCASVALTFPTAQCLVPGGTFSQANHPITAVYSGDAVFSGSTSNTVNQVVSTCNPSI